MKRFGKDLTQKKPESLSDQLCDLVKHKRMGTITVIVIADAIAADARFSVWFFDNVKGSGLPEDLVLAKLDEAAELSEKCKSAIRDFQLGGTLEDLGIALKEFSRDIAAAMKIEP